MGVDEAGRGPLAGPVTVAAVALPDGCKLPGVRDSKLMTPRQRRVAAREIRQQAIAIGIGWASSAAIDELGLTLTLQLAGQRALRHIYTDTILLDGNHNYLADPRATTIIGGDRNHLCIAAASIIAKTARDAYMERLALVYPHYGFGGHKGYGTPAHLLALKTFGPTPYHRLSWAPMAAL